MQIWWINRTLFWWIIWMYAVLGYDIDTCQIPCQWSLRAKAYCIVSPENYSCLYNVEQKNYSESCLGKVDYVKPGYRYVIKGRRANGNCSDSRYQPVKFWSNRSSECEFLKNKCNEIGQVIFCNRSSTEDRSCRCDYRYGFDFVVQPIHVCYCIPSEEDCSCYRKKCSTAEFLTKDYVCDSKLNDDAKGGKCLPIEGTRTPSFASSSTSRPQLPLDDNENHMEPHMNTACLVSVLIFILSIITMVLCKKMGIITMVLCKKMDSEMSIDMQEKELPTENSCNTDGQGQGIDMQDKELPNENSCNTDWQGQGTDKSIDMQDKEVPNENSCYPDGQRQGINHQMEQNQPFNLISVTKTFLIEEMDTTIMINKLKEKGFDLKISTCLLRKKKAVLICEFLEEKYLEIIGTVYAILKEEGLHLMLRILQTSAQIFKLKHGEQLLKKKINQNMDDIVKCLIDKSLIIQVLTVLKERDSLQQKVDDIDKEDNINDKIKMYKILDLVMENGVQSMLQFVYALFIVGEYKYGGMLISIHDIDEIIEIRKSSEHDQVEQMSVIK